MKYAVRHWIAQRAINLVVRMNRDSEMVRHCQRELATWLDEGGSTAAAAQSTVELLSLLSHQGHPAESLEPALSFFSSMARFEPFGELLGTDEEWNPIDYGDMGTDPDMKYQNIRCSRVFKRADGTAYDIYGKVFREPDGACYTNEKSHVDVKFPYRPKTMYIDVKKGKFA